MQHIIIRPLITEKSMADAANSRFTFIVAKDADKNALKREIEARFKVNVVDIATMVIKGKTMRVGQRRAEVKVPPYKKAVIALKKGQKISLFELGE